MTPLLQRRFDRLLRGAAEITRSLAGWTPQQLRHRPAPAVWCAVEVLDHLARTDRGIIAAMKRNLAAPHTRAFKDRTSNLLVHAVMLLPTRVKVPAAAKPVLPAPDADPEQALVQWQATHRDLAATLEELSPDQCRSGVFQHPVGGWYTVPGTLSFLIAHTRHHRYQLDRIRRSALSS